MKETFYKACTMCETGFFVEKQEDFSIYFFRDKKGKYKHNARCKECCRKEKQKLFKKYPEKMNCNYVRKAHLKLCIVCDKEFLAREEKHICCSDDCKKLKDKVRNKLDREKRKLQALKKRKKDIKKAIVRNKHYSDEEVAFIKKGLDKCLEYKVIAKKLGRTTIGVGKIARKIKNGQLK